jgi:hypothetical protein
MTTKTVTRALVPMLLLGAVTLAACTPQQQAAARAVWEANKSDRFASAISDTGLARLRACESGGDYRAVSSSGAYRGAYQFSRGTWNSVAGKYYPQLRGVDPAAAAPADQDHMARALWATGGPRNWPVCSKRV